MPTNHLSIIRDADILRAFTNTLTLIGIELAKASSAVSYSLSTL